MTGWGDEIYGVDSWGGGDSGGWTLLKAIAINSHTCRVFFDKPMKAINAGDINDALTASAYTFEIISGTGIIPEAISVVKVDSQTFDIKVSTPFLTVQYRVWAGIELQTQTGAPPAGQRYADFQGFDKYQTDPTDDYGDIKKCHLPNSPVAGRFGITDTGDIAIQQGVSALYKRLLRRLITKKGGYVFYSDFGIKYKINKNIKPRDLPELEADAKRQLLIDDMVQDADVKVIIMATNIVMLFARVISDLGMIDINEKFKME